MRASIKIMTLVVAAATSVGLAGCAPSADSAPAARAATTATVKVGMITSITGPLAAYAAAYKGGFEAGLDYATKGTGAVDGRKISVTWTDDQGNPASAVAAAKTLIGEGDPIIGGTVDSGIALTLAQQAEQNKVLYISGPAAADAITGINKYTFRSGRQSYQDVATAGTFIGSPSGKKVVVFAQNGAFGQGNLKAVTAVLGAQGAKVSSVLVPESATEFTPFAQQLIAAKPDLVFVAWAGATTAAMWQALQQQDVFHSAPVVTGLATTATYNAYGPASGNIKFLSHYFPGATSNSAQKALDSYEKAHHLSPDLFSPDGFAAAQLVVRAVGKGGGTNVNTMISALEGYSFDSVKGALTVRAQDHAMLQPMFEAKLTGSAGAYRPQLITTVNAATVAPPITAK